MNSEVNSSKQGKFEKSRWILLIKINSPNGEKQSQRGSQRHFKRSLLNGGKGLNLIDLLLLSFNRSLQYFEGNYWNITIQWATFNTNHMPGAVSIDAPEIKSSFQSKFTRHRRDIRWATKLTKLTHTNNNNKYVCQTERIRAPGQSIRSMVNRWFIVFLFWIQPSFLLRNKTGRVSPYENWFRPNEQIK